MRLPSVGVWDASADADEGPDVGATRTNDEGYDEYASLDVCGRPSWAVGTSTGGAVAVSLASRGARGTNSTAREILL